MFRWLINIFILSEDQSQDWVEKYCRSIIDLCSRLIIFIILKQRRNVRGGQEVWSYVKAVGLLVGVFINPDEQAVQFLMNTALLLTRPRTCSASLTAPAQVLSLQLPSFYCWLEHGCKQAFLRAGLMLHLPAWTKQGLEAISTSCTTCEVKSPSELVWSLHSRLQNHKSILLASRGGYFSFYHTNSLLFSSLTGLLKQSTDFWS